MSSLPESTKNQNIEIEISTLNSSAEISSDDKILINNELKSLRITHELSEKTLEGVCAGDDIKRCLLYTSDAADDRISVDLGGRRIIKKKKK